MPRISLPLQIVIAICVGTILGIVLGPICSIFEPIGTAFIMFIQMVILLYIPSSIIHGLGSTSPAVARQLFRKGWVFLFFMWALIFLAIFLLNNIFPKMEIIFDASKTHSKFEESFLSYLVPKNPIYDLANNIIPAIAIFAIIMGVALMHLTHKEPLISFLERINNTIEKVLKGITAISPFGVAAIFANVTGNLYFKDVIHFGFYIFPLIILVCIFTFWALPALLKACTPLKYREIISEFRSTCLLAFVIGSPSIAIPFLNQCIKRLSNKYEIKDKELHNTSQMIVPLTYTFTQVGNLLILFFIMFLSYYYGLRMDWLDQALVSLLTIPMSFGGPELAVNSVSFLIEKLGFPDTALILFDKTSIITQNFQVLLSVASMTTFAIILLLGYYNRLTFKIAHFFKHFFPIVFILIFSILVSQRIIFRYQKPESIGDSLKMAAVLPNFRPAKVYKYGEKLPDIKYRTTIDDPMTRIFTTNQFFIGYHPHLPPFSYFNKNGELVGYDIAFAYQLAHDLNVTPVFIPFYYSHLGEMLENNIIDIAASPVLLSAAGRRGMNFPQFYFQQRNVFIVLRQRKNEFINLKSLQDNPNLIIGNLGYFELISEQYFPFAKNVEIIDSWHISHALDEGIIDAMYWELELAQEYCKRNPEYIVIDYGNAIGDTYLAFPVKFNAFAFIFYLNSWINLAHDQGFDKQMYEYWMLGHPPVLKRTRWNILDLIRNKEQ
ncbi:MAG: cation:dicarboxylase symporter family transporter [Simkania sp.]|nr:cation:dicarboxylase symporter family transporter [Simkania sp.]